MLIEKKNEWLIFIAVVYLVLGIKYAVTFPIFEAPDENHHFDYIKFMIKYHRIPVRGENTPGVPFTATHPPLFYFFNALIYGPLQSFDRPINVSPNEEFGLIRRNKFFHEKERFMDHIPFYLLRLFSVLLGLGTVFFTWKTGEIIFEKKYHLVAAGTAVAAFIPQFIYISSSVNNDNLVNLISTLAVWLIIKCIKEDFSKKKDIVLLGLFLGIAAITKFTGLFLIPLAVFCFFIWQKNKIRFLKDIFIIFMLTGIIAGWYYVRNYFVSENLLVIKFTNNKSLFSYYFIRPFATVTAISFFGVFGWMNIIVSRFIYKIYIYLSGAGIVGTLIYTIKAKPVNGKRKYYSVLFLSAIFSLGSLIKYNLYENAYQGRYLFNVISSFAILVTGGYYYLYILLKDIFSKEFIISDKNRDLITLMLILILAGLNIYIINTYIRPSFIGAFI